MNIRSYAVAAALWTVAALSLHADAIHNHCGGCSQGCQVQKVCRVVCEMKEVKETKYKCECEDFCVPGHSQLHGCKEIPTCGEVRTRKKLVKYEEVKKVPHYKCVVKYLCPTCCHQHGFQAIPTNVKVVDGGDAPSELIPTLAEKPAESVGAATPAVKPVSRTTLLGQPRQ